MTFASILLCSLGTLAASPRVAVWDPGAEVEAEKFVLSSAYAKTVAAVLSGAGVKAELLDAASIADPARFGADRFDALFTHGGALPGPAIPACREFAKAGGVLVALGATNGYEAKVVPDGERGWAFPAEPKWTWHDNPVHRDLGLDFRGNPAQIYAGVFHRPGALLRKYLPEARDVTRPLAARWFRPASPATRMIPLLRSRMAGASAAEPMGSDYTPQCFLADGPGGRAILCLNPFWCGAPDLDQTFGVGGQYRSIAARPGGPGSEAPEWPFAGKLLVAFARIAADLRSGALDLAPYEGVTPVSEVVAPPPFSFRGIAVGTDPEGIRPLARVGAFDGNDLDAAFADLSKGIRLEPKTPLATAAVCRFRGALPAHLERGTFSVVARAASGATRVLWAETLVRPPAAGNDRYAGAALEVMRLAYVPAPAKGDPWTGFAVEGCARPDGVLPDAFQVEPLPAFASSPAYEMGAHTSTELAYDGPRHGLTADACRDWTHLRCTTRMWWIGAPGEAGRFDRFDRHVERYLALHPSAQFILEGTPRWAAISEARWLGGGKKPHMSAPDNDLYAPIAERVIRKYADRVQDWEIGNETTVHGFWNGSFGEFTEFYKRIAPLVRKHDPSARVISAGMAGVVRGMVDPYVLAMSRSGALAPEYTDLFGVHCYHGQGLWDVPYGLAQGDLFALGEGVEVYANEQGASLANVPEAKQAELNDRGIARLLASGATKFIVFQSDSPAKQYGMLTEQGAPRPAYAPFRDYLELAQRGGRRLPVAMTGRGGAPVEGVYAAAARHDDGSVTLVLNPADRPGARAEGGAAGDVVVSFPWDGGDLVASGGAAVSVRDGTATFSAAPAGRTVLRFSAGR